MFKVNYRSIIEFTSLDIGDYAAEPPFVFEMLINQSDKLPDAIQAYIDDLEDIDLARMVITYSILTIRQGEDGERFKLDTVDAVVELEEAIEEGNPGQGERFIHNLALGSYVYRRQQEEEKLKNSETSLDGQSNGVKTEPLKLAE